MARFTRFSTLSLLLILFQLASFGQKKISLDDLRKDYTFFPDGIYGLSSMKDGLHYTVQEGGADIVQYSYETGEKTSTILDGKLVTASGIKLFTDYSFNADETRLLLLTNREPVYRRSFKAEYYIFDRSAKSIHALSSNGKQQLATFSPDGKKVAFIRNNNLFIVDLMSGEEKQITSDGFINQVINGAPDWVYEEEFEYNQAFEWSPDSRSLAFCRFDERKVKTFGMTMYKGLMPEIRENALYPENRVWKYPKAGEDNSIVTVHIYDLESGKTLMVDVGSETDQYIPRIRWTRDKDILCVYRLNRLQNKLELLLSDRNNGSSRVFYTEENKYYIDEILFDSFIFCADGRKMLMLSERDGWTRIWLVDLADGSVRSLNEGNYDVTALLGVDEDAGILYYQAAESSPLRREVYSIKLDGSDKKCLSALPGTNEAEFSEGCKYFINTWSNASTPQLITLHKADGTQIRVLEDNTRLKETLRGYKINYKEFFTFRTSAGIELNGFMIKPADFNKKKKYPVVMTQYSGPNSQEVADNWGVDWEYLLAQEGYLVVCVDGRGTGCRGEEFRKMTYLQLGKYETLDQIETARFLGTLPFVDKSRIGIFGWSYGGFMVCNCMTKGAGYFKLGIAVAPVTNWRYYDNIYTERFLRKPQDNPGGYDDNSPINDASKLEGKLLLVHGTGDDNVHVQNTLEFAEALVQAGKQFDMHLYTNRNHGIYGGNTSYHLYRKMTDYIKTNL
ncbi:MAG: S9 family peptidase [Bacteroidales bacterium]